MSAVRVLVTGAGGQLATSIVRVFEDCRVTALGRAELDIANPQSVRDAVRRTEPNVIVNCAAFNDVDGAEGRPLDALAGNAFGVRSLAREAEQAGATLVHYGTDFVFDGTANEPYTEESAPAPRSTYALSKLLGEWFALGAPDAFVLRVESLFGTMADWRGRRGTLDGIVDNLKNGRAVKAFTDRVVSPSYIEDIAAATRHLVLHECAPGLYHCVNSGHASWFDVAQEAATLLGAPTLLERVTMADMPLRASRPRFCALSNDKLARAGFRMPDWQDALRRWLVRREPVLVRGPLQDGVPQRGSLE